MKKLLATLTVIVLLMLLAMPVQAQVPQGIPPEVAQYAQDWPLPNRDYANTRATMDSTINSGNVENLGAAWVFNVPIGQGTFGSISTMPIIMGDTVFLQDIGNNIYAVDIATGALKWQKVYNLANLGPNGICVGYGKVFGSASPYEFAALDAETGQEVWRTKLIELDQGQNGVDIQPVVYNGVVYLSTVPGNAGVFYAGGGRGVLYALDQESGEVIWSFDTVDSSDVWGNPVVNSGGGSWYPPAIDIMTGISYWAIANPAPFPGQKMMEGISQDWPNGSSRPGPNLYTNTLMALDGGTGEMVWYNQVLPHDISDYDLQISPILADADYGGVEQEIVISAGKMGQVYAFNRETGALIWKTAVGEHNGNDLLAAYPADGTITIMPGIIGGVETPMAYADGVLYVPANNLATDMINGLEFTLHPFTENTGNLVAIDVDTGHILWDKKLNSGLYGGATVVNDMVFTGTYDGMLYAFKRDTGEQVWSYQSPAAVNSWPSVAGDTIIWPIAGGGGASSVIAFKLGSTTPMVKIVEPAGNAALPPGDLMVLVQVSNFNLSESTGQANAAGEGRIVYYLDTEPLTAAGQSALPAQGTSAQLAEDTYTFKNVPAGAHTVAVQLVNNDNTPLSPPVVARVQVTMDTAPRIQITDPDNGAIKSAASLTVHVDVSGFNLVDKVGQTNVAGEGHILYSLDTQETAQNVPAPPSPGAAGEASIETSHTFTNLPVGIHQVLAELVNNNGTPLSPRVVSTIQVYTIEYTGGLAQQ